MRPSLLRATSPRPGRMPDRPQCSDSLSKNKVSTNPELPLVVRDPPLSVGEQRAQRGRQDDQPAPATRHLMTLPTDKAVVALLRGNRSGTRNPLLTSAIRYLDIHCCGGDGTVYMAASKAAARKGMWVRIPPAARARGPRPLDSGHVAVTHRAPAGGGQPPPPARPRGALGRR